MSNAKCRFAITSWDEKAYSEADDRPKLTRASVVKTLSGDIEGEGRVEYLMMYRGDGSASFVGHELIVGTIAGRKGSFMLQRTGRFENGRAIEDYTVIAGSGTGELRTLKGDGHSEVGHGMEHPFEMRYELA